jgi:hypothetical protein
LSLTLSEEHTLRLFENRVLRRIFGPMWNEVTRGWRKLHNEELHKLCSSPNIVRMNKSRTIRWAGNIVCMGEMSTAYKILVGKSDGKRPLRKPRPKWGNNIKMYLREVEMENVDWIHMA